MAYDFATVDPGLHTAIAYWVDGERTPQSIATVNVSNKAKTDVEKLLDLRAKVLEKMCACHTVYIEGVAVYAGSLKSMTSAVRGNLSLLAYIVGVYVSCFAKQESRIVLLSPQWKGQLTYDALAVWVGRINGCLYRTEHELATVGMGLYVGGLLR